MTARVRAAGPDELDRYGACLASWGADFLQSPAWGQVKAAFGWIPHHLWIEEDGRARGAATILERPVLGRWCLLYCPRGPVLPADPLLWNALGGYVRRWPGRRRPLWLRVDPDVSGADGAGLRRILSGAGFRPAPPLGPFGGIQPRRVFQVDLTRQPLFEGLPGKTRYNIRLARRKGISVRLGGREDVAAFHALLAETARRDGFLARSRAYYERVFETLNTRGMGELLLAEKDGILVAASWVVHFGRRSVYLYGASASAMRNLMGTYLVQWEGIRRSRRRGAKIYDLLGVPLAGPPEGFGQGLAAFKSRFGALVELLGEYDLPVNRLAYALFRLLFPVVRNVGEGRRRLVLRPKTVS